MELLQSGKLKDEHETLTAEITDLKLLLESKQRVLQVMTSKYICMSVISILRTNLNGEPSPNLNLHKLIAIFDLI